MATNRIWLSGFVLMVVLTSSIYFIIQDDFKIDIQKTRTKYYIKENVSFELAMTEYVYLFDGTRKMRAKNRSLEFITVGSLTTVTRTSSFKEGIILVQNYVFDSSNADIETIPST